MKHVTISQIENGYLVAGSDSSNVSGLGVPPKVPPTLYCADVTEVTAEVERLLTAPADTNPPEETKPKTKTPDTP